MATKRKSSQKDDQMLGPTINAGVGALMYRTLTPDTVMIDLTAETIDAVRDKKHVILTVNEAELKECDFHMGEAILATLYVRDAAPETKKKGN